MSERLQSVSEDVPRSGGDEAPRARSGPALSEHFVPDWVHQMRNPLFGLQAVLDGLEAESGQDDSRRAFISLGQSQIQRLRRMADDLLAYGAPPRFDPTQAHLGRIVHDAIDEVRDFALGKGVAVVDEISSNDITLHVDHGRLVLALSHLVRNAIRRSAAGGHVVVRHASVLVDGSPWRELIVDDDGASMDDAARAAAFEPFAVRSGERTGLELAIVMKVALQHAGRAGVEARPSGGLSFVIALPVGAGA